MSEVCPVRSTFRRMIRLLSVPLTILAFFIFGSSSAQAQTLVNTGVQLSPTYITDAYKVWVVRYEWTITNQNGMPMYTSTEITVQPLDDMIFEQMSPMPANMGRYFKNFTTRAGYNHRARFYQRDNSTGAYNYWGYFDFMPY